MRNLISIRRQHLVELGVPIAALCVGAFVTRSVASNLAIDPQQPQNPGIWPRLMALGLMATSPPPPPCARSGYATLCRHAQGRAAIAAAPRRGR
ncbi:MAG: hypothetical protein U5K43_10100 [Halofilum sp. (in: g-proteobacteria)]|nr:hypothetical protein [Halofilum sp. (in: g-proteobacteria)]